MFDNRQRAGFCGGRRPLVGLGFRCRTGSLGVLKAARTLHSVNAMARAQMNVRSAVSGNQVVPPPKSRVNATVAPSVAEHRRPPSPLTVVDEALNMELDVVRRILDELMGGRCDLVIFTTGSSVWSLFVLARELGRLSDLVQVLQSMTTACRSPKAAAILRRFKVEPTLGEPGLYTSCRLIYALGRLDLAGRRAVRLNGDRGDPIANRLRAQRARLREFSLTSRRTLSKPAMSELFGLSERATGSGREPAARPSSDAKESLQWPDRARDRSRRSAQR